MNTRDKMVISEIALGLLTNLLYDSTKKIPGILSDPSSKAYKNAIKELNKQYRLSEGKIDTFLHKGEVKRAIKEYLENPKSSDILKTLTDEFLASFAIDNFSREYAKSIIRSFFEILDNEIDKNPELKRILQSFMIERIDHGVIEITQGVQGLSLGFKEINQGVQETNEGIHELSQGFQEISKGIRKIEEKLDQINNSEADLHKNEPDTDFKESIKEYLNRIIVEDNEIGISEVYTELSAKEILPITLKFQDEKNNKEQDYEVLELVEKEEKLIISGESGSGKTTTLKWLNFIYAKNCLEKKEELIPLYVELNSYIAEKSYIEGLFFDYVAIKLKEQEMSDGILKELLLGGKAILLLDGLDLLSPTNAFFPYQKISNFISEYSECKFIITSRPGFFENIKNKNKFKVAELERLTDEKIRTFINKYVPDQTKGTVLRSKILNSEQLKSILTTPMMLYLAIEVAKERKDNNEDLLPTNRTEIYEAFITGLFNHYEIKMGRVSGAERTQIKNALSELYFEFHRRSEFSCEYEKAKNLVGEEILKKCIQLGLLVEKDLKFKYTRIEYGIHQSFQEYFAAIKLKELFEKGFDVSEAFCHLSWEEIVIFTSEMMKPVDEFIDFMISKDELFLASKCTNRASYKIKEILCGLLADKMDSGSELEITKSIESLGRVGTLGSSIIAETLDDEDIKVRLRTVKALSSIESETSIKSLIKALKDENRQVWITASKALGKMKSETAVQFLINALMSENKNVRESAASALGDIKSETAVKPLINLLEYEEELGVIRSETAVKPLIIIREYGEKHAKVSEDGDVWRSAYRALISIKVETEDVQFLINEMKDYSKYIRRYIAGVLGRIESEKVENILIKALKDEDEEVRCYAAESLGNIKSEKAVQPLIDALNDENDDVRKEAAEALGEIKSDEATQALISLLKYENEFVREDAVRALGKIKSDKAVQPLIGALSDKNQYVRKTAADALGNLKSEKAVQSLINAMKDKELDEVEFSAIWALKETVKSDTAIQLLINALSDESSYVQEGAANVLEKTVKSDTAIQLLINALSDENKFVRESAASVLEKTVKSDTAIQLLKNALCDKNKFVQESAASVLKKINKIRPEKVETKKIEIEKIENKKVVGTEITLLFEQIPYRIKVSNKYENKSPKKQPPGLGLKDAYFGGFVDRLKSATEPITIVDYGCGEGKFLCAITTLPENALRNILYIGVDISTRCRYISRLTAEKHELNKKFRVETEFLKPEAFSKKDIALDYAFFMHVLHEIELKYLPDIIYSISLKVKVGGKIFILDQKELVEEERSFVLWDDEKDFKTLFENLGFNSFVRPITTGSDKKLSSIEIEKIDSKYFTLEEVGKNCLSVYKSKQAKLIKKRKQSGLTDKEYSEISVQLANIVEQIAEYERTSTQK